MTDPIQIFDAVVTELKETGLEVFEGNPAYGRVEFSPPVLGFEIDNPDVPEHITFGARQDTSIWTVYLFTQNERQLLTYIKTITDILKGLVIPGVEVEILTASRWVSRTEREIERHGMQFPFTTIS